MKNVVRNPARRMPGLFDRVAAILEEGDGVAEDTAVLVGSKKLAHKVCWPVLTPH